jgi:DNA repair protein REV1
VCERVQAVSVDEALVDISNLIYDKPYTDEVSAARTLAQNVRDKCRELTRCEVSVGIGMSIVMARLALRKAKPAGQFIVQRDDALKFLDELKIRAFPGVGGTTSTRICDRFGTEEVHEVRKIPKELLRQTLGQKTGERIYELCRGIDNTLVGAAEAPRQSISVDINWGVRFVYQEQAETFVYELAREVEKRMKGESVKGVQGTHLTLKVAKRAKDVPFKTEKFLGCGRCDAVNKSFVFKIPTCDAEIIGQKCVELLRACQISPGELRGIGVGMKGLEEIAKEEAVQRKLQFQPAAKLSSSMPALRNLPPQHEMPAQPTRAKEYVKPKVATLFDAFTKRTAARKAELQTSAISLATPELIPAIRNNVRPKPPSLVDELIVRPAEIRPVSASGGFLTPDWKVSTTSTETRPQFVAPSSSPVPSTQFDIPSPSQIDIECLPHLPTPLREAILRKQVLRDASQARRLQEEGRKGEVQLEQPPNSQWDLETWNTFSQSVRDDIRVEHVAEKEAERKRESAKRNIVSPPKKKQGTLFSVQPPKSPSKKQGPLLGPRSPSRPEPKRPPPVSTVAVPKVYDAHGNEVSSWLFAPQNKGGAGIDPDVFVLYDAVSRRSVVSSCVTAHEARLDAESRVRAATKRDQDRLNGALHVQAVRQRPLLVNSLGAEVGSSDLAKVREAVKEWVRNCGDEPLEGDVEVLVEFSGEMLKSERRADKATALVRWLTAYLDDKEGWEYVAGLVRDRVAEVAEQKGWRGLVF